MTSNAFGMGIREDLQGKTHQELKDLEQQNKMQQAHFNTQYPNNEWLGNEALEKERDAIQDDGLAIRTAMSAPHDEIKVHGIPEGVPVVDLGDSDDDGHCTGEDAILGDSDDDAHFTGEDAIGD